MKKVLFGATIALAAFAAHAAGISVIYNHMNDTKTPGHVNSVTLDPSVAVAGLTVDGLLTGSRAGDGTTGTTAEVRVRKDFRVTNLIDVYGRVGAGSQFANGNQVNFYTINPGVQVALTPKLYAIGQYTYENSFTTGKNLRTNTWDAGVGYALTKTDAVEVHYVRTLGDAEQRGFAVYLDHAF
jgi:hypothetical protein